PRTAGEVPRAARRRGQVRAPILTFKRARKLRTKMSLPEVLLWQALRSQHMSGLRFRRQHPVGPYILDFYCASARLAVEIDGSTHDSAEQIRHDERRNAWLASRHIKVLRIAAVDVLKRDGLELVLLTIEQAATPSTAFGGPPPPLRRGGSGE
ncbi:MAG: endonuclease domain-containing protein, partial [Xanthobacteraceae bacterium]